MKELRRANEILKSAEVWIREIVADQALVGSTAGRATRRAPEKEAPEPPVPAAPAPAGPDRGSGAGSPRLGWDGAPPPRSSLRGRSRGGAGWSDPSRVPCDRPLLAQPPAGRWEAR